MKTSKSSELYNRACQLIPGGVNSPVRAFKSVGMNPLYIERGEGAYVYDADGNKYLDFVGSWGPLILGHADPDIVAAITEAAAKGTSFGACSPYEVEMAELVHSFFPSMEMVRMVNSGTEATMSAIRLARAFTGRNKIIKFEGCYHGHADSFLIKAGSGLLTLGIPGTPGITEHTAADTLVASFNNIQSVEALLATHSNQVAAIIIEPVMANAGVILPDFNFLGNLRQLATVHNALLIFDEVITGFRVAKGGVQEISGVIPDLTCLGKIIGGGLPVGAFGGRKDIMQQLAPEGPVYQAGTLSGNPLAMAAGIATLKKLQAPRFYEKLNENAIQLELGIIDLLEKHNKKVAINRIGSMFTMFFYSGEVHTYAQAMQSDSQLYARYFREMLEQGIYLAPSQFEASFLSFVHEKTEIDLTLEAMDKVFQKI